MCGTRLAVALSGLGGVPLSPSCRHKSHPGPKPRCPSAARLLAGKGSPLPRFPRRRPPLTFPPPRAGPDRRRTEPVTTVPTQSSAAAGCHSVVSRRSRHRVCFRCRPPHHLVFPRAGPPGAPATEPSSEKSSLREPLEAELAVYLDRSPMRPSPTFLPRGAAAAGAPPFHAGPSVAPPRCRRASAHAQARTSHSGRAMATPWAAMQSARKSVGRTRACASRPQHDCAAGPPSDSAQWRLNCFSISE
jgi:hypothetical protein